MECTCHLPPFHTFSLQEIEMGKYTQKNSQTRTIHIRGEKSATKETAVVVSKSDKGNSKLFHGGQESPPIPHIIQGVLCGKQGVTIRQKIK